MVDLLDRENLHLLLEQQNNSNNSFIANINKLALHLKYILDLNGKISREEIEDLLSLFKLDLQVLIDDLKKGSLFGFRKLDIDLLLNFYDYTDNLTIDEKNALWNDFEKQVYYDAVTVKFTDRTSIYKDFNTIGVNHVINNHHQLYEQFNDWVEFKTKATHTMFSISPDTPISNHELLRFWDGEGDGSNIESITLHVANPCLSSCPTTEETSENIEYVEDVISSIGYHSGFAGAKEHDPVYYWLKTTSVLEAIFQRINELLKLSLNVEWLVLIAKYLDELSDLYKHLDTLLDMYDQTKHYWKLVEIYNHLQELLDIGLAPYDNIPEMDKPIGNSGDTLLFARGNHIHPSDTTKVDNTTLENTINTINISIADTEQSIKDLEQLVEDLKNSTDELDGRYTIIVTNLQTQINLLQTNLIALQNRVTTVETELNRKIVTYEKNVRNTALIEENPLLWSTVTITPEFNITTYTITNISTPTISLNILEGDVATLTAYQTATIEIILHVRLVGAILGFVDNNKLQWLNGDAPSITEAGAYLFVARTFDQGNVWWINLQGRVGNAE